MRHAEYAFGAQSSDIASAYLDVAAPDIDGVIDVTLSASLEIGADSTPELMNIGSMTMPTALTINATDIALEKVNHNGFSIVQGAIRPDIHPQLSQAQTNGSDDRDYSHLPGTFR